ncbi:MAG: nuclear transport factor 2 family protein [Solirubrobacterales bacterium]|nr:nuclear transport factor 2 family protein [Solirubrobacterales bacterium]
MEPENREAVAREFVRAFNERDLDAFTATLDPGIELHSMKGVRQGVPAAREWADRSPGGVQQTVVVTSAEANGDRVLLRIRRDWHWAEDGSPAGSDEMAWFFLVGDSGIVTWMPFTDNAEASAVFTKP